MGFRNSKFSGFANFLNNINRTIKTARIKIPLRKFLIKKTPLSDMPIIFFVKGFENNHIYHDFLIDYKLFKSSRNIKDYSIQIESVNSQILIILLVFLGKLRF